MDGVRRDYAAVRNRICRCSVRQRHRNQPQGKGKQMKSIKVNINSIDKVKKFVNILTKFEGDFDLISGHYVIDAKSIMGIFSLDLAEDIELVIHDAEDQDRVVEALKDFMV